MDGFAVDLRNWRGCGSVVFSRKISQYINKYFLYFYNQWDPTTLLGRFLFSLNLEVLFAVIFKGWDDRDILAGDYFQAVQGLNFYVEFNRNK
jgi:hypothetical protein